MLKYLQSCPSTIMRGPSSQMGCPSLFHVGRRCPHRVCTCAPGRSSFQLARSFSPVPHPAPAQDKGSVDDKPLPPLDNPKDPKIAARRTVRAQAPADLLQTAKGDRLLHQWLPRGRRADADHRRHLAGDAAVDAISYWGYPDMIALLKRLSQKCSIEDHRLAGHSGRRYRPAARRTGAVEAMPAFQMGIDADIPAGADAGSSVVARGARGDVGDA